MPNDVELPYDEFLVLRKKKGVLVIELYATWCVPCTKMKDIVNKVAKKADGYTLHTGNVEGYMEFANEMGCMAVPTFFVLKDGKAVDSFMGDPRWSVKDLDGEIKKRIS